MARRLLIAAIVAITIGAPIVEMFDRWDQTMKDGNDTEAGVVVVAMCIGVAFAIGTVVVVNRLRTLSSASAGPAVATHVTVPDLAFVLSPVPTVSPPTILRV